MAGSSLPSFGAGDGTAATPRKAANDRACDVSVRPDHDIVFDDEAAARELEPHGWSYAGATLSLARTGGADADDRFGATGSLSALIEGGALVVGCVTVGTVTRNSGGRLLLTFSGANAAEDYVDAVLRQITYANTARHPDARVDLHWAFADGHVGGLIAEGCTVVTMNGAPIWRSARRAA